jgi:hypothetical protein
VQGSLYRCWPDQLGGLLELLEREVKISIKVFRDFHLRISRRGKFTEGEVGQPKVINRGG